jgi:hypothetical protein
MNLGNTLFAQEPSLVDLDTTIYALDSTTIDLCLSVFEWAPFRSTKAAAFFVTRAKAGMNALARALSVPPNRVGAIVNGTRATTADTALRLGKVDSSDERAIRGNHADPVVLLPDPAGGGPDVAVAIAVDAGRVAGAHVVERPAVGESRSVHHIEDEDGMRLARRRVGGIHHIQLRVVGRETQTVRFLDLLVDQPMIP